MTDNPQEELDELTKLHVNHIFLYDLLANPSPKHVKIVQQNPVTSESQFYAAMRALRPEELDIERVKYVIKHVDIQVDEHTYEQIHEWAKEIKQKRHETTDDE